MKKEFKVNVIKRAIPVNLADFLYNYFILKRSVAKHMFDKKWLDPASTYYGTWHDLQCVNTYAHYADIAMETLLKELTPKVEEITGFKLIETYSYSRIYKKGDILSRHTDRKSCAVSCTMYLGGDMLWPIYIEESGKTGMKGTKIVLKKGDMLLYEGDTMEHWREPFSGENCAQVFLHYNKVSPKNIKYDSRAMLGLPVEFRYK